MSNLNGPVEDKIINVASEELKEYSETPYKTKAGKVMRVISRIVSKVAPLIKVYNKRKSR